MKYYLSNPNRPANFFDELDNYFNTFFTNTNGSPAKAFPVDITQNDKSYDIFVDLPGFQEDEIEVQLEKNILSIAASHIRETDAPAKDEKKKQDADNEPFFLMKERVSQSFKRSFTLPDDIDAEKISAKMDKGVLKVSIARAETAKPKLIKINFEK